MVRWACLLVLAVACDARFEDLRDIQPMDAGVDVLVFDAGEVDAGGFDAGEDAGGLDAGELDVGGSLVVLGRGRFEGRSGYDARGEATLEQTGPGSFRVTLSEDFSSAAVPGPVLVVSPRESLGTALDPSDVLVMRLTRDQIRTGGVYDFESTTLIDPATVFIYCEPFGVETARALLEAP